MFKLIALDIDETLTDSTGQINHPCIKAVNQALSRGIHVALISARSPVGVEEVASLFNGPIYRACYLGAIIQDPNKKNIQQFSIDDKLAEDIILYARKNNISLKIISDEKVDYRQTPPPNGTPPIDMIESPKTITSTCNPPLIIVADGYLAASSLFQYCSDRYSQSLYIARHFDQNNTLISTLITSLSANKGLALRTLCKILSIHPQSVLVIGDSESDVSMFEIAGVSVAVANASPSVKSRANYVAPFPWGDGVLWALSNLL